MSFLRQRKPWLSILWGRLNLCTDKKWHFLFSFIWKKVNLLFWYCVFGVKKFMVVSGQPKTTLVVSLWEWKKVNDLSYYLSGLLRLISRNGSFVFCILVFMLSTLATSFTLSAINQHRLAKPCRSYCCCFSEVLVMVTSHCFEKLGMGFSSGLRIYMQIWEPVGLIVLIRNLELTQPIYLPVSPWVSRYSVGTYS